MSLLCFVLFEFWIDDCHLYIKVALVPAVTQSYHQCELQISRAKYGCALVVFGTISLHRYMLALSVCDVASVIPLFREHSKCIFFEASVHDCLLSL